MSSAQPASKIENVGELRRRLADAERQLAAKTRIIDKLEQRVAELLQYRFGRSSEKNPAQGDLSLFNEAELAAMQADIDEAAEAANTADPAANDANAGTDDTGAEAVPDTSCATPTSAPKPKATRPRKPRVLPDHLERVRVTHGLDEAELRGACGAQLVRIGEEITEQIGVIPARQFVIQHVKTKYACACKDCGVRTAPMPAQPLPGSQASALVIAFTMIQKYLDGLPLYRQQQIWARAGLDLNRSKLARWMIEGSALLQPLYNLMQDEFFGYDIALSDDTGIQVLKEDGRAPNSRSALWIRRGGPPDRPVVLLDYDTSKGAGVASRLLAHSRGYLVCDAAQSFDAVVARNGLTQVLCNDHARRKFVDAIRAVKNTKQTQSWVAPKAIKFYARLYKLEAEIADLPPCQRHGRRQREAIPIWETMMAWAKDVQTLGVRHAKTRTAINYLIRHEAGLRRYCEDGRLPISNIQSEHVAKTVAVMRKNFLFADTPAGATASAMIWSVLESARANRHNPLHYMTAVLSALPNASSAEDVEQLLPWRMDAAEAARRYHAEPMPADGGTADEKIKSES